MATYTSGMTFSKHDDYMTPYSAWEAIAKFIPGTMAWDDDEMMNNGGKPTIWDPFYGDGESKEHLAMLGVEYDFIHHEDVDFFSESATDFLHDWTTQHNTVIVTNPPFSKIPAVLTKLKQMGLPFIMIMPSAKICTQYFRKTFAKDEDPIQLIIPRKRIQFIRKLWCDECQEYHNDETAIKACNFDCFYYCWKMGLERDIIWLE